MNDPRYPIGKAERKDNLTPAERQTLIGQIAATPAAMRRAVSGLTEKQLERPYREGGWTVRQVAHHVPDSHLNSYCRFKLALTEETPVIRPYDESAWANLADTRDTPVETSLTLLESLHERWVNLLRSMRDEDFARRLRHPELGEMSLDEVLCIYAWHGRHHVAHITTLREQMGWI